MAIGTTRRPDGSIAGPRVSRHLLFFALAAFAAASRLESQGARRVEGSVLAATDSSPLAEVEVRVVGFAIWTLTDSVGRFVMRAPAGPLRIAIRRIGLKPDTAAASGDSVTMPSWLPTRRLLRR